MAFCVLASGVIALPDGLFGRLMTLIPCISMGCAKKRASFAGPFLMWRDGLGLASGGPKAVSVDPIGSNPRICGHGAIASHVVIPNPLAVSHSARSLQVVPCAAVLDPSRGHSSG